MIKRVIVAGSILICFLFASCSFRAVPAPAPGPAPVPSAAPTPVEITSPPPAPAPPETPTFTAPPVPGEFQALYQELDGALTSFEAILKQKWAGSKGQTIFATELAFANGNIGEGLLLPQTLESNLTLLDRLQAIGVKGVVLSIKFPLLKRDFPRSAAYLKFYQAVAAEARQRGLKVLVKTGAIFSGTPYSSVNVDWSQYTTSAFLQSFQEQLWLIAREIKPDYLNLTEEPTTQEALTGLRITPADWNSFVSSTLKKIERTGGIMVGAGMGNWEDQAYINDIWGMTGIDYIDLHIYPSAKKGICWSGH
jgi:hypothetical protein